MLRSRFLWKLYAGYALLIVLTALVVGTLVASSAARDAQSEIDRGLLGDATLLRELAVALPWQGDDLPRLRARVDRLAAAAGSRLTVIRADGVVVADSAIAPSGLDNHGLRPEVVAAQEHGFGSADRRSRTLGQRMRYVAVVVADDDGMLRGVARAAVSVDSVEARLAAIYRLVALGAGIATLAALALAFFVAQRVTRPLREMTVAAKALADGDYRRRVVAADRGDELGSLADAFNVMRTRLREQLETATLERGRLEAILASMVEGVVAVDGEERIVHVNQVAAALLGVAPESVVGRQIWQVSRHTAVTETLRRATQTQAPAEEEMRLPGRADLRIELRATPLKTAASGLEGAVLVLDDVTTVRRLETVRQDFVANVSHELKTPVTAIRGLAETVLDDPDMPAATARGFLERIREQSLRLSSLVVDLLSLSRLDAGNADIEHEAVDVRQAVRAAVRALAPASEAKAIRVELALPDAPVSARGASRALEEAVSNLLDNAIKYSPAGETVTVRLSAEPSAAKVSVTDRGSGIPRAHQDRIFERFYRVDTARSRAMGGTGLGLAIVKHIVLSMGGDIVVESEPGTGSTFTIRLPRHDGGG